jgi:CRP-like cAMP-binding protein
MLITAEGLRRLEGLEHLAEPAAQALIANGRARAFAPQSPLFREGQESHGIFIVLSGEVRVVRSSRGRRHVLHTEKSGGTLGEAPFFDHEPFPATAIARTSVVVLYIDRAGIHRALRASPEVALFFLSRLAGRVRLLADRADRLATASVAARMCAYLLACVARSDSPIVAITQESLAEELGTVREVVMRTLRGLRERKVIATAGRGRIEIIDRPALRALAAE